MRLIVTEKAQSFRLVSKENVSAGTEFRLVDDFNYQSEPAAPNENLQDKTFRTFGKVPPILSSGDWEMDEFSQNPLYKRPSFLERLIGFFYA